MIILFLFSFLLAITNLKMLKPIVPIDLAIKYEPPSIALIYKKSVADSKKR